MVLQTKLITLCTCLLDSEKKNINNKAI